MHTVTACSRIHHNCGQTQKAKPYSTHTGRMHAKKFKLHYIACTGSLQLL